MDTINAEMILQNQNFDAPEVKEIRANSIGASEIGAVCGLVPWVSPLQLWAEKTGKVERSAASVRMRVGNAIQPFIGQLFAEQHPSIGKVTECQQTFRSREASFAIATPDFWIDKDDSSATEILEVKCVGERAGQYWQDGATPDYYAAQVQYQLRVLQLSHGWLSALVGNERLESVMFEHDKNLTDLLLESAERFLECCKRDIPPQAGADDWHLVKQLISPSNAEIATIEDEAVLRHITDWYQDAQVVKALKESLGPAEKRMAAAKNNILLAMNGAKIGRCGKYKISSTTYPIKEQVRAATTGSRFNITLMEDETDGY